MCASFERLSQLYSHLFAGCTTEISSSDAVRSLLQVHREREAVLLQLSTVRRLFSEADHCLLEHQAERRYGKRLQDEVCRLLTGNQSLVTNMVGHLEDSDQLVTFCSTKALCAVLLHPSIYIKLEWLDAILTPISPDADDTSHYASAYRLQLFSELLKVLRKRISVLPCENELPSNGESFVDKQNICFLALERHWSRTLCEFTDYLSNSKCPSPQPDPRVHESTLGEILSLTVEMMKHNCATGDKLVTEDRNMATECTFEIAISFSGEKRSCMDVPSGPMTPDLRRAASADKRESRNQSVASICSCQHTVVSHLPTLVLLVKAPTSVFLLKRLLDVFLKAIDSECVPVGHVIKKLHLSMGQVLQTRVLRDAVGIWAQGCALSQVRSPLCKMGGVIPIADKEGVAPVRQQDYGRLNTTARKLLLLLLKCTAVQVHLQGWPWDQPYRDLARLVHASLSSATVFSSQGRTLVLVRTVAFQLLSEQDDCIVEALLACCRIHQRLRETTGANPEIRDWYYAVFDVHWLFVEFVSSITFDHSVLLDLLVSPETKFPEFFQEYLKMVVAIECEWEGLKLACAQYGLVPQEDGGGAACGDLESTFSSSEYSRSPAGAATVHDQTSTSVLPGSMEFLPFHADHQPEAKRVKQEMTPQNHLQDVIEEPSLHETEQQTETDGASEHDLDREAPSPRETDQQTEADIDSEQDLDHEEPSPHETDQQIEVDSASEQDLNHGAGGYPPQEPCLDRVMGCCIRLKYTLERLLSKALLPNPTVGEVLIHLLEDLEDLYESD